MGLTAEHAEYLRNQAVDPDLAIELGVRSLVTRADTADLPGAWPNFANFPALLFPWTNDEGRTEYQIRPDNPTADPRTGKPRKYVFGKDMFPALWAVRKVARPSVIVIIEGTKQSLAAASYAPDGVSIYGIAGCRLWQFQGSPIPDLAVADGHDVVIVLDADAAENTEVFKAGNDLAEALAMEGAGKVLFTRLPGGGKSGLDDVLAARPADRRKEWLTRLIKNAKPKPADRAPRPKGKKSAGLEEDDGRPTIVVNNDRYQVINDLTDALLKRWNATTLFCHGGVISRRGDEGMTPLDKGLFNDLVQITAKTVTENEGAHGVTRNFSWPDGQTMLATMSRADQFVKLERLAHAPFLRPDGTIVTEPGYDEATRTILIPDEAFAGIEVPQEPSPEQITAARDLIMNDWLGDFPFDGDADRANVMALIVTPAIRGLVPRVPMAVLDGLQMGVGKNKLADSIISVYTGRAGQPMNWVSEADELRKQITSAFRGGAEFFMFDEAHTLEGAPLAQALTAETWQDRILGVSTMANFPNRVTWLSLGNNVQVRGDITRRVYRIALRPKYANPQDRPSSSFRHPGQSGMQLEEWVAAHRRDLMVAILTLVRAWFAAGQPYPVKGVSFGSFEAWERIAGGIVEKAGMVDFLGNLRVWRSESDFDTQYWEGHLRWLHEQFGEKPFRTADVRTAALDSDRGYLAPPKLDDTSDKGYGKALGEAYSRNRARRYGAFSIDRDGTSHGHVGLWRVHADTDRPGTWPESGPTDPRLPGDGPEFTCPFCATGLKDQCPEHGPDDEVSTPDPQDVDEPVGDEDCSCAMSESSMVNCFIHGTESTPERLAEWDSSDSGVLTFDLETGDADDLYRTPGTEYVRIGATAAGDRPVVAYDGATAWNVTNDLLQTRNRGGVITGHNVMAFDLPALVRSGDLTMIDLHEMAADGQVFDTLLAARYLDPPMARDKGVDATRKYDLGTLAQTYGLGEKLTDVSKPLGKKYGGWAGIPIDLNDPDPERAKDAADFREYMIQDVELSRRLHAVLMERLDGTVPEYLVREHRVAALAAQISINGILVDQLLLNERITEIQQRKAEAMGVLAGTYGVPTTNEKGKPYASPLASKGGKEAIAAALLAAGVSEKALWRTEKTKELQVSAEHMLHLGREYHDLPAVLEIVKNVYRIVSARSVYQTAADHLCPDGRVHPKIGFEQSTGRWSVTRPGLTVFGKRAGKHVERAIFLPDPGQVMISVDLSQIDMRAVAGLSQDQAYIRMLHQDDPHTELAVALFGDRKFREQAKAIGHGWNYGESLKRISEENEIDPALVRRFDQSMRDRFPRLVEWRDEVRAIGESGALLDNGFGRKMRPDPQRSHTQSPALLGQGCARDLMAQGLLRLPGELLPMLRAQIHDEVVLSVPEKDVEEIGRTVVQALTFEWRGVPILSDVSRPGTTWAGCYEKG